MNNDTAERKPDKGFLSFGKADLMLRFLKGSKRYFLGGILCSAMVAGLDMVTPQIIRIVVDYCLDENPESLPGFLVRYLESLGGTSFIREHLWYAAAAVLIVAVVTAVFQYLNTWLNAMGNERMTRTMRDMLYDHIGRLPCAWHMQNQTGDIIQRCTSDVNTVRDFVSEQLIQVVKITIQIVFSLICMVWMNITLSVIVFVSIPVILGYSCFFFGKIGGLFLQCDENEGELSTIAQENLTGVRVVRAFGRENYERERFHKQNMKYTDAWMSLSRLMTGFWMSGDLLIGLQTMLLITVGSVLCVRGQLTAGVLIAFASYNRRLVWPVRHLARMISEMSKAGVSMDRLLYILKSETEDIESDAPGERPAMTGDIVLDHVSFGYEPEQDILKDISMTIEGGTTVGILGATGSGKSTLIGLLDRLYEPGSGSITVDGVPMENISLAWVRTHVGVVLQEPYLFSRTIGENIGIAEQSGRETAGKESGQMMLSGRIKQAAENGQMMLSGRMQQAAENGQMMLSGRMRQAAETAALEETVQRFVKGYDTVVGERGVTLSGGQKQRTAIARMLMQDAPVMIFDDSLSAVDAETDEKIRANLRKYHGKKTVIQISHRISTLREADRIFVFDQGRIAQSGSHEELVREEGIYRDIWEIQQPKEEEAVDEGSKAAEISEPAGCVTAAETQASEKEAEDGRRY